MYAPKVQSAKPQRRYRLGLYAAGLFSDIESPGPVRYLYILVVFKIDDVGHAEPCFYVASEVNETANTFGGGSHFLCVFDEDGHSLMSDSDEWANMDRFATEALALAARHLRVSEPPVLLP